MSGAGKRIIAARQEIKSGHAYELDEALELLKRHASKKHDETVELAANLNIDPRHADQMVRGVCSLPNGTGKEVRIAVFARDDKAEQARQAGADIVGAEDLVEQVQKGKIDFDRVIATPDMMALVGRLGRVLGPRGLMPNPRFGTVTPDIAKAVAEARGGAIEFRAEKSGIVHAGIGKLSFATLALAENASALIGEIMRVKPSGAKGKYIRKLSLSSTHGPGLELNTQSVLARDA